MLMSVFNKSLVGLSLALLMAIGSLFLPSVVRLIKPWVFSEVPLR